MPSADVLEGCRHAQRRPPGLRVELERLRRESRAAVLRGPATSTTRSACTRRPRGANELIAHSYSHLYRLAGDRSALFHRLRTLGPARHGPDDLRARDPRRRADQGLQSRQACGATSRTSTTSSTGWFACCGSRRAGRPRPRPHDLFNIGNHDGGRAGDVHRRAGTVARPARDQEYSAVAARRRSGEPMPRSSGIAAATGFAPTTSLAEGLARFVAWYRDYHAFRRSVGASA